MHISINIRKRSSDLDEHMRGIMGSGFLTVFAQIEVGAVSVVGAAELGFRFRKSFGREDSK